MPVFLFWRAGVLRDAAPSSKWPSEHNEKRMNEQSLFKSLRDEADLSTNRFQSERNE